METDIEGKIRSRIEAILINDARSYSELRLMAADEEPLDVDLFAEERNLYQRIINNYRNAVNEVNGLLEENVSFLSGLCRIAETIKDKRDFHEIGSQVVDCILQELGAEFCSLSFPFPDGGNGSASYFEGIRENHKFMLSHSHSTLMGNPEFAHVVRRLAEENGGVLSIGDVYREPRFNSVDFPGVVRSLVCLPIRTAAMPAGMIVLSHSMPNFFTENHIRVLRILASCITHVWILTADCPDVPQAVPVPCETAAEEEKALSVVLVTLDSERYGRRMPAEAELVQSMRRPLEQALQDKESVLPYENIGFLVLMPGTGQEKLSGRAATLRNILESWRAGQKNRTQSVHLNLGYASCADGEELTRTLEIAAQMMCIDPDDAEFQPGIPA